MQAATSAVAIPVVAFIGTRPVEAAAADRSAWNRAVGRLRAAEANYCQVSARGDLLHDAADAICPREDEFFTRYDLGHAPRERNVRAALRSIFLEGRGLAPEEARAEAERVVDAFEEYEKRHEAAFREYDAWEVGHDTAVDERHNAREALLNTGAPDHAALLFKIELLTALMDEACVEDADSMAAIHKDARRLLVSGRA